MGRRSQRKYTQGQTGGFPFPPGLGTNSRIASAILLCLGQLYIQVFVKGKDIPPNAIIAGEERRRPLYIARTFFEV